MLEEVGCDYDTVVLAYEASSLTDAWGGAALARPENLAGVETRFFRDVNPMGKVPAIEHDRRIVTESPAIVAYLADSFPEARLAPATAERSDYYRWLFFAAGPLEQAVTNHRAGFDPESEQEFFFGYGSFERTVLELERAVQTKPFIAGDRFTAADVYVGAHIGWGLGIGTLPPREAFVSYISRLTHRAAFRRAAAKDEALLAHTRSV